MQPADRLNGVGISAIRRIAQGAPEDAISLGLGEPTWDMPEPARRALAAFDGVCSYGPQPGRWEVRESIARYHGVDPGDVLVTHGTQEALYVIAQAFLNPGDEVLVPDPGFVGYPGVIRLAGAVPRPYRLSADDRFRLDADAVAETLEKHPRARMIILNHPSNPTGGGASLQALRAVADLARAKRLLLVSDEVYRELHFDLRPPSLLDVTHDGFVLNSVSKGFGCPGLRLGWAVVPSAAMPSLRIVHGYAVTCASSPAQRAAAALLNARDEVLPAARREVGVRFDALREALREHFGHKIAPPDGSFYHLLPLPQRETDDPLAFCLRLRENAKVVLVPGVAFGEAGRPFARLSFAALPDRIHEAVARLAPHFHTS